LTNINNEGTALLDIYDRIYAFRLGEVSKGNFAVWVAHGSDGFDSSQEKLFDKTGTEIVYSVADLPSSNSDNNFAGSDYSANAVLYKVDAGKWIAMRPTEGNLKSDVDTNGHYNGEYTFLKTDADKGYDVIIKTGTYNR
jgi:hypothetical protein